MFRRLLSLWVIVGIAGATQAHFVFVVPEANGTKASVILSEDLKPDAGVDVKLIKDAKLSMRDITGRETGLKLTAGEHQFSTDLPPGHGGTERLVHGTVSLGVTQRGEGKPHVLMYHPKTILGDAFGAKTVVGDAAPVEIVPVGKAGALKLKLVARGKPVAESEMAIILPDGTEKRVKTDAEGQTPAIEAPGRYGAWARFWETKAGEEGGKKYEELRHYATLVFDAPAKAPPAAAQQAVAAEAGFASLPEATSSFGAVISDGWLYVYGGHIAPTHTYSTEAVSGKFNRRKLGEAGPWEALPSGPGLQGMNLAAHGGKVYRIGGMQPKNKPGDAEDLHSLAECARFNPATKVWEALPPLPEPRSSHDIVVVGDKLYVVGGWWLRGSEETKWPENMLVMDLAAPKLEWKGLPQAFKRRALIASVHAGKIYVMGGFSDESEMVQKVDVYDPQANRWSEGPSLPPPERNAFAPAAGVHDGFLYLSVGDGTLYRLDKSQHDWETAGKGTPRIVHRLVSTGTKFLVLGGALKGANLDLVEVFTVPAPTQPAPR